MIVQSYAKINLSLNVKKRREDGYHELTSIMLPIGLHDTIEIIREDGRGKQGYMLTCDNPDVPCDGRNLILRAVALFEQATNLKTSGFIHLTKRIPMEAGLGGGSSNAATVLHALNALYETNVSLEQLVKLGVQLGADVPFFLLGKPALVEGIGEVLQPITCSMPMKLLLVKPEAGVSTKEAYQSLNLNACDHPDCNQLANFLCHSQYERSMEMLGNSLEESAFRMCGDIKTLKLKLLEYGFDAALMSGSGSTVFGITNNAQLMRKCFDFFKESGYFVVETEVRL